MSAYRPRRESFDRALETLTPQDARRDSRQWQELKNVDWSSIQNAVTKLFQLRKYPDLVTELPQLNEKLSNLSRSEIGQFIGEFYQEHMLKKCMIILRQEVVEEKGSVLLQKLAEIWTQFYTSILPTLQAIFVPVQLKGLSVRALTLISFRDVVLLKLEIAAALEYGTSVPPEIKQMLLVLQSVHKTPPSDQFFQLQALVERVVQPYLCLVTRTRVASRAPFELSQEEPSQRSLRSETVSGELDSSPTAHRRNSSVRRRYSLTLVDLPEPS